MRRWEFSILSLDGLLVAGAKYSLTIGFVTLVSLLSVDYYGGLISINQSNFYSANIPSVARVNGVTSKSVLNSKIDVYGGTNM